MVSSLPKALYEEKVATLGGWLFYTLLVAGLILACSELGRLLGLPGAGLKISIFWPAAGIALSALLLFGLRLIPAIFIGALAYNTLHLLPHSQTVWIGLIISLIISLGSTLQATCAYYILARFASVDFYNRFRDTLIFLLPAGLLTCMICSALSVGSLILTKNLPFSEGLYVWMTFWIGDTAGVYLITPLIIGFLMPNSMTCTFKTHVEAALLLFLLVGAAFAIYFGEYPLAHLLLPFILWGAFRFNIRGASTSLIIVFTIAIIATALGHGPFAKFDTDESLFFLITFINTMSATTLILVSVLNEREKNAQLLRDYNLNLESIVVQRTKQLQITQEELQSKEKLASLGVLISGISYEIRHPLTYIRDLAKTGEDCTQKIKQRVSAQGDTLPDTTKNFLDTNILTIEECLQQIEQNQEQVHKIVKRILQQSRRDSVTLFELNAVRLHDLLDSCSTSALQSIEPEEGHNIEIIKKYDKHIDVIDAIGDDLHRVFSHIIENALYALRLKMEEQPSGYTPILTIKTKNYDHTVEISIKDNGVGMSDAVLRKIFTPFFSTKPLDEGTGLGLALTYDIVVQEHHGTIVATSQKGVFTEFVITLPKVRRI